MLQVAQKQRSTYAVESQSTVTIRATLTGLTAQVRPPARPPRRPPARRPLRARWYWSDANRVDRSRTDRFLVASCGVKAPISSRYPTAAAAAGQHTAWFYKARAEGRAEPEALDAFDQNLGRLRSLCGDLFPAFSGPSRRRAGESVLTMQSFLDLLRRAGIVRGPASAGSRESNSGDGWWEQAPSYRFDLKVGRLGEGEACAVFAALRVPEMGAADFQVPACPAPELSCRLGFVVASRGVPGPTLRGRSTLLDMSPSQAPDSAACPWLDPGGRACILRRRAVSVRQAPPDAFNISPRPLCRDNQAPRCQPVPPGLACTPCQAPADASRSYGRKEERRCSDREGGRACTPCQAPADAQMRKRNGRGGGGKRRSRTDRGASLSRLQGSGAAA